MRTSLSATTTMPDATRSERASKKPKINIVTVDEDEWERLMAGRLIYCDVHLFSTKAELEQNATSSKENTQPSKLGTASKKKKIAKETDGELKLRETFKRVRGRRGLLGAVNDMPQDIIYEARVPSTVSHSH